uniref:Uncharacterized protein n=1 Tax=Octopus bimaculoides TaxID=37653 RepID=A0A0L8I986_OCTBM
MDFHYYYYNYYNNYHFCYYYYYNYYYYHYYYLFFISFLYVLFYMDAAKKYYHLFRTYLFVCFMHIVGTFSFLPVKYTFCWLFCSKIALEVVEVVVIVFFSNLSSFSLFDFWLVFCFHFKIEIIVLFAKNPCKVIFIFQFLPSPLSPLHVGC